MDGAVGPICLIGLGVAVAVGLTGGWMPMLCLGVVATVVWLALASQSSARPTAKARDCKPCPKRRRRA